MENKPILIVTNELGGNYMRRLQAVLPYLRAGRHIVISHDGWCGMFSGNPCNCDPEFQVQSTPPVASQDG